MFFFSSRRRHTRSTRDWSSDVCSSDLAVALIDADSRVLLAQRPEGKPMAGLWEFPGGKVHAGEAAEAARIRERKEELAVYGRARCMARFAAAFITYDRVHLLMADSCCP